jgi:hypothetical protein
MKKHVLTGSGINKTKTFVRNPLDRTFSHRNYLPQKKVSSGCRPQTTTGQTTTSQTFYSILLMLSIESSYTGKMDFAVSLGQTAGKFQGSCPQILALTRL